MTASLALPVFRYLNYVLPVLGLIVILGNQRIFFPDLARPYLVLIAASIVLAPFANKDGIQDIYLILTGLSLALTGFRQLWSWNTVFSICIVGLIVNILWKITTNGVGSFTTINFNIAQSESTFESSFSYVFGLLAIWAAHTRKWKHFFLAALLTLLTLKRIAVLAMVLCVLVQLLPPRHYLKLLAPIPMLVANSIFLVIVLYYGSGHLDKMILEYTSQSADQLGMGRQVLYSGILRELMNDPLLFLFTGMGPGEAYSILSEGVSNLKKVNLHGDTLKVLYEYGGMVLIALICFLYSSRRPGVLAVALYTNILFLTDNTLIYPFFIYFALLVASNLEAFNDMEQAAG